MAPVPRSFIFVRTFILEQLFSYSLNIQNLQAFSLRADSNRSCNDNLVTLDALASAAAASSRESDEILDLDLSGLIDSPSKYDSFEAALDAIDSDDMEKILMAAPPPKASAAPHAVLPASAPPAGSSAVTQLYVPDERTTMANSVNAPIYYPGSFRSSMGVASPPPTALVSNSNCNLNYSGSSTKRAPNSKSPANISTAAAASSSSPDPFQGPVVQNSTPMQLPQTNLLTIQPLYFGKPVRVVGNYSVNSNSPDAAIANGVSLKRNANAANLALESNSVEQQQKRRRMIHNYLRQRQQQKAAAAAGKGQQLQMPQADAAQAVAPTSTQLGDREITSSQVVVSSPRVVQREKVISQMPVSSSLNTSPVANASTSIPLLKRAMRAPVARAVVFADWPYKGIPTSHKERWSRAANEVVHPKFYAVRILKDGDSSEDTSAKVSYFDVGKRTIVWGLHHAVHRHAGDLKIDINSEMYTWPRALVDAYLDFEFDNATGQRCSDCRLIEAGVIDANMTLEQLNSKEIRIKVLRSFLARLERKMSEGAFNFLLNEKMVADKTEQVKKTLEQEGSGVSI